MSITHMGWCAGGSPLNYYYLEMSKGLADSGIEKWTVDTKNMTMTFYDKVEDKVFAETIS
jgi:uncharacterized protein YbcV (DUF1398 family)